MMLGRNVAEKTTTVRGLVGLTPPRFGTIEILVTTLAGPLIASAGDVASQLAHVPTSASISTTTFGCASFFRNP